ALDKVAPNDVDGWRDLALAEMEEGDVSGSATAFARVLDLAPHDTSAMVHLAHARHAMGQTDEAVSLLLQACDLLPERTDILRSLVGMARAAGANGTALEAARRLAEQDPKDVLAALDVAELLLAEGDNRAAAAAFYKLRSADVDDGHEAYACHAQAEALVRDENWRQALDVGIDATRVDRHQLTTDLLAFIAAKLFGEAEREAKSWPEIDAALSAERAEHRRMHEEAAVL
ncbi:MAG: Tetratricopeptide repeat, partial [Acidimicrobiaceae bacterium]|nr:Tetratricopeptide repeat [Acidimicrobiaceae bacterium]